MYFCVMKPPKLIQYASDLHLEFPANEKILLANSLIPVGEILILVSISKSNFNTF